MDFGIFILVAVFMVIRAAINSEQKRKKEQGQKVTRMQQAYGATDARADREPTAIERELRERPDPAQQEYGEGYSVWGDARSGSLPPREKTEQQTLMQGQSAWGTTTSGSLPPSGTLSQGQSTWGTSPSGSLPPRSEEERKRRDAAALAAQRAENLRRERMERIARNKAKAQQDAYASCEGTDAYGQEGVSFEGRSINSTLKRHKLEASSLTGHAHTESSLGAKADNCDDYSARDDVMGQQHSTVPAMLKSLSFQNEDVVKGFIFGEILSKPKALRR